MKRTFYYTRVSSCEQNLDRQLEAFVKLGANEREIVIDKESDKSLDSPGYQTLKTTMLRSGDTLIVKSLDLLGRDKSDIKNELEFFRDNGVHLKVIDLPTTMVQLPESQEWVFEMINSILIEILDIISEQKRETIHRRKRTEINVAKSKRKRPDKSSTQKPADWDEVIALWRSGEITAKEARQRIKMRRKIFYKTLEGSYEDT